MQAYPATICAPTLRAALWCFFPIIVTSVFLQDRSHTLKSFAAYADWAKALHFSDPAPRQTSPLQAQPPKRRKISSYSGPEPTVEEIEAEFWRIVEVADDVSAGSLLYNPCTGSWVCLPCRVHAAHLRGGRCVNSMCRWLTVWAGSLALLPLLVVLCFGFVFSHRWVSVLFQAIGAPPLFCT